MASKQAELHYLIMDMQDNPLGRGERETPPDVSPMRMEILDDKIDDVACHEKIKLLSMTGAPALECKILRSRGDFVMLEVLATASPAGTDMRRNLRVPVEFDSLLYPVNGIWPGRRTARSVNLSCGGIAFEARPGLWTQEIVEIVVPTVEAPLILKGEILRQRDLDNGKVFYAAKFVDMCEDEEMLLRETVFSIQLENRPPQASANN